MATMVSNLEQTAIMQLDKAVVVLGRHGCLRPVGVDLRGAIGEGLVEAVVAQMKNVENGYVHGEGHNTPQ